MKKFRIELPLFVYGLFPAACCLLKGLSDRLYTDVDSFLISISCAGLYSSNTSCPVIHPLLSTLIGQLSRLWPTADWFSLLSQGCMVLGIWWLGTLFAICIQHSAKRWTCILLLCFALLQHSLFNINFTVWCGFFSFIGVTTVLISLRRALPYGAHFMSAFFLCLAVLWRMEGVALLIPFLLLDVCTLIINRSISFRHLFKTLFLCLLPAVALVVFSSCYYMLSPTWHTAVSYSATRSELVDYPHRAWSEARDELTLLNISENDYNALTSGVFLDTDIANIEMLEQVSSISKVPVLPFTLDNLFTLLQSLPSLFNTPLLRIFSFFVSVLFIYILFSSLPLSNKIESFFALCGSLLICLYYLYVGRLPERVILCVVFSLLSVLLPLFLCTPATSNSKIPVWRILCAATGCLLCLCLWKNRYNYHIVQPALLASQSDQEDTALLPGYESGTVYLWNSTTLALYMTEHYMEAGKLPSESFVHQNLPWGEWNTSGQIYFQQLLAELDMPNPMQSLLTRPRTYLVAEDISSIETWLQEHYDASASANPIGTVDVFALGKIPIWQITA